MGGRPSPQLLVEWADRRGQFQDALRVLRTALPVLPPQAALAAFRADVVARGWPARALAASVALHVLFVFVPLPEFLKRAPAAPAGLRAVRLEYDLRWAGNARFLPPIAPKRAAKRTASLRGKKEQPLPPRSIGADARQAQTIVSDPPEPNHPRQTLLTQLGLEKVRVPVRDLHLPNMVIPPSPAAAPAPELDLRRVRAPAAVNVPGAAAAPQPPRPKLRSQLALAETRIENLFPRLAVESGGSAGSLLAPDVGAAASLASTGDLTAPGIIALSANPAAPRPVLELPEANFRARFTTGPFEGSGSPGGIPGGAPEIGGGAGSEDLGGEGAGVGGLSVPGVFVSNAGPAPPGPVIVGPPTNGPGGTGVSLAPSAVEGPVAAAPSPARDLRALARQQPSPGDQAVEQRAEELIEGPGRGARPSSGRRVYSVLINMPNLTSQTGSWVLRFAELGERATSAGGAAESFAIEAPVAVKKVDPRYPGEARRDHLEGVVYLYGVIREDGSVDSVRVVRSVHELLDTNAVAAFQRWQFEPGRKNGVPVALEVVVEIPFRLSRLF